jgi:ABC-type phosphate transport system permease subunit
MTPPAKLQPALLGGVAIGVLSALPVINIANCCCAWILFGGALAAYLMQQNHPEPIQAGDGALVGLMAGVVGSFVYLIISVPISLAMGPLNTQMMQRVLRNSQDMPPEVREMFEAMSGGPAIGIGLVLGFFVMLFLSSLFGMLGGIFGALMFKKDPPSPPPPPPGGFGGTSAPSTFTPPTFTPPPLPPSLPRE